MRVSTLSILITACLLGACAIPASAQVSAQDPGRISEETRIFVDSRGDTIRPNPANLPYKLVNGVPDYKVGTDDVLELTSFEGTERRVETARVFPDSTVTFSILKNVRVGDQALSEVVKTLNEALARYVRSPQIQVQVKEYRSKKVSVFGSINSALTSLTGARMGPGVYPLKGRIRALEQIIEAGGPTQDARLDQVSLIRAGHTYTLNLQLAVSQGDTIQNVFLEDGDVLRIAGISLADRRVAVLGEVSIPGVHSLSSEANMLEAIAASRGFTQDASANRIRIIRRTDPINPEIITVNAERILAGDLSQNIGLLDGDIIVVPRDRLTDLNDLLGQLTPILSWGGLVTTSPIVTVSGFQVNEPGGGGGVPGVTTTTGGVTAPVSTFPQQQVIDQVQRNLRKPTGSSGQSTSGHEAGK